MAQLSLTIPSMILSEFPVLHASILTWGVSILLGESVLFTCLRLGRWTSTLKLSIDLCLHFPPHSRWGMKKWWSHLWGFWKTLALSCSSDLISSYLENCEFHCPHSWLLRILSPGDRASLTATGSDTIVPYKVDFNPLPKPTDAAHFPKIEANALPSTYHALLIPVLLTPAPRLARPLLSCRCSKSTEEEFVGQCEPCKCGSLETYQRDCL